MTTPAIAIVILSPTALDVARTIAGATGGVVHGASSRLDAAAVAIAFDDVKTHMRALFAAGTPVIAVMAAGAVIRLLAPVLADKRDEPPVIAVSEDCASVVPLLGGHHGGNDLARVIAAALGGHAAVTTAGDLRFGLALDAPPPGWRLGNPENAKAVMAELVAGASARIEGEANWLLESKLPWSDEGAVVLRATLHATPSLRGLSPQSSLKRRHPGDKPRNDDQNLSLNYHPQRLVLGIGCERGCDPVEAIALAEETLASAGLADGAVGLVASLDLKADEPAVHAVARHFGVPARFFAAEALEAETPRLANPSDVIFAEVGCHGVCEGAALTSVGTSGELVVPKRKSARATCAIARAVEPLRQDTLPGRARGQLFVVGIGPGSDGWRSPEVTAMVGAASDLVGYSLYLDLLGPLATGKTRHDFDLGREEDRVRHAMELAGEGRDVALVCSGDAGIYAMATLVFELLDKGGLSGGARRIAIDVSPGISALQAAAARAGAPLGHDFCTISLSDLLTPIADIRRRVQAAGEGDFVIAFYNPVSKKRRTQLAEARDELLRHRPADTPVILATNLGRAGETVRIVPLGALDINEVDMLTVVIVGSSQSRVVATGDGRRWVYTPRGYGAKEGTGIET